MKHFTALAILFSFTACTAITVPPIADDTGFTEDAYGVKPEPPAQHVCHPSEVDCDD